MQPANCFSRSRASGFDGHDFVEAALEQGAVAAVVRKDQLARYSVKTRLLAVDDTLVALQTLATAVRQMWGKTLIGVTGSVGKTTTKEAIAHVLATRVPRARSPKGNFNNHFGLPLQLLKLEPEHDIAVIEMGMSHAGEIAALAQIAQPEIGVVTNVAPVHLEFFDSVAGIARAKYELIEALPAGGTAVLNADDEYVSQFGRDFKGKVVMFGLQAAADVRAENIEALGAGGIARSIRRRRSCASRAQLRCSGSTTYTTCSRRSRWRWSTASRLSEAAAALPSLTPADKRGQVVQAGQHHGDQRLLQFQSEGACCMVDALAAMPAQRRIVVAGEMLELGQPARAASRVRPPHGGAGRSISCSACAAGASDGGSSAHGRDPGRIRRDPGRGRRMAGARDARGDAIC